jgi:GNAT superfamily N-acetyltransferase
MRTVSTLYRRGRDYGFTPVTIPHDPNVLSAPTPTKALPLPRQECCRSRSALATAPAKPPDGPGIHLWCRCSIADTPSPCLSARIAVVEAQRQDAAAIAAIHLTARRQAIPYLRLAHPDDKTRVYFARMVGDRPQTWWVVRHREHLVAYMLIEGENIDHLYVAPGWQGLGFGSALVAKAKTLSPKRLVLWTFQRNGRARAFYDMSGFWSVAKTDGENE